MLEKMDAQHALKHHWPAARLTGRGLWIERLHRLAEGLSGDDTVHVRKQGLPAGGLPVAFDSRIGKALLAHPLRLQAA